MQIGKLLLRWGVALVAFNAALVGVSSLVGRVLPRGDEIVYTVSDGWRGDIYLMDVEQGLSINLTNSPAEDFLADWSADGERIAFRSQLDIQDQSLFYTMDANGRNTYPLPNWRLRQQPPADFILLSPDHTKMAVISRTSSYILDTSTKQITQLDNLKSDSILPIWSPDSERIAYVRTVEYPSGVLEIVNIDNQTEMTHVMRERASWIGWLPDNRRIAFAKSEAEGGMGIYTINRDGSDLSLLAHLKLFVTQGFNISPDASKIVFEAMDEAHVHNLYVFNIEQDTLQQLTKPGFQYQNLQWSPDGNEILFSRFDMSESRLYIINVDGTNERELVGGSNFGAYASWRPRSP